MRTRRALAALVAGSFAGLGIGSGAAAPNAGGEAWTTHRQPAGGFALGLPASWLDISRRTPAVAQKLAGVEAKHPSALVYLSTFKVRGPVRFIAIETSGASLGRGFPANLNVVRTSTTVTNLAVLEEGVVAGLEQSSALAIAGSVGHSIVRLPAGRAIKIRYPVVSHVTAQVLMLMQYILLRGKTVYVLTFTTLSGQFAGYKPTFERSAKSFRFLSG